MAMELITGKAGTPHIDSADIGAYQAYTVGDGVYILHGIEAAVATANSVTVTAGYGQGQGRAFAVKGAGETLTIDSGQSGYKRNDVIAVHYTKDGAGIERTELVVIKGTPASSNQVDPPMPNNGNVLNGATDAYWPLYRVTVDGLAPQEPVRIAGDVVPSNAKDYIVAEGTSGDWMWRIWSSGLKELYYRGTYTPPSQTPWTNVQLSPKQSTSLPLEISEVLLVVSGTEYTSDIEAVVVPSKQILDYTIYAGHNIVGYTFSINVYVLAR